MVSVVYSQFLDQNQTTQRDGIATNLARVTKLLLRLDGPHQVLLDTFEIFLPKLVPLILESVTDLDHILISAHEMRKSGIFNLVQDSNQKFSDLNSKFLSNLGNSDTIYKTLLLSIIILPVENLKQTLLLSSLKNILNFGNSVSLFRSESMDLLNLLDAKYLSKIKSVFTNASSDFQSCWVFHAERRNYLRFQLRQIYNLCQFDQILENNFSIVVNALLMAKNEILWYFRNNNQVYMDKIKSKKLELDLDLNIFELLNLTVSIGNQLKKSKNGNSYSI